MYPPPILDPADARPRARADLLAWIALQHALALAPERAAVLLRDAGDPRAALAASERPQAPPAALERDRRAAAAAGAVAVPLTSPAYPWRLATLPDPPPLLWVRGDVAVLREVGVAVVGSRAATVYGRGAARALAGELAREGAVVVSGLAVGIDAEAHRGALEAGGRTVAVLPCGPDRVYPRQHRELARAIAARGAVATELPVGAPPKRAFFALRNRLISGLARALVVVEARERSGSLISARHAADQGRDVFAVPGPIHAPTSAGPNRLLREGAWVATEARDVLEVLAPVSSPSRAAPEEPASAAGRAILAVLREACLTRDELGRRLSRPPHELAPELLELELSGRVAEDRDGRLRVIAPAGA